MEPPLKSSPMTLYFFLIIVFCSEVVYTLVPDADQVAKNPKVSHFDCGAMTEALSMLSTRYYNSTSLLKTWKSAKRKSFSTLSISEKNLMQQNSGYNINARSDTADITTTAALITLKQELLVT